MILAPFWGGFWVILASVWGSFWGYFAIVLGSCSGRFGVFLKLLGVFFFGSFIGHLVGGGCVKNRVEILTYFEEDT